jgi:GTP-binding protein
MTNPALVAIVGRPNVGKSTLFNRLVGRRRALVTDEPGVTRDRLYGEVRRGGTVFRLVDTGGMSGDPRELLARGIEGQARAAVDEASVIVFVVDARVGRSAVDEEVASWLRRRGKPVVVVANKAEARDAEGIAAAEFGGLGLGPPVAVSAEHGLGVDELLERIESDLDLPADAEAPEGPATEPIRLAIVGRPNVGKSSLLNRLLGAERVLVSAIPGTTRDAVDSVLRRGGRDFVVVDTAGIRRKAKWSRSAERLAALAAERAIARAQVVALVLDATEPLSAQDAHIAGLIEEAARPLVVVVNKWDLARDRESGAKAWEREIRTRFRFGRHVPVLFASAKTGQRASKVLDLAEEAHAAAGRRVPTPELNRWLHRQALQEREDQAAGRSIRLYYAAQTGVHPPRFVLFCNDARRVHFSLRRRIENDLREEFSFGPAPIRLSFRSRTARGSR